MAPLTDDDIYPVGKYNESKTKMADVPAHYLIWVHDNENCPIEVSNYVMENWDVLQKEIKTNIDYYHQTKNRHSK